MKNPPRRRCPLSEFCPLQNLWLEKLMGEAAVQSARAVFHLTSSWQQWLVPFVVIEITGSNPGHGVLLTLSFCFLLLYAIADIILYPAIRVRVSVGPNKTFSSSHSTHEKYGPGFFRLQPSHC